MSDKAREFVQTWVSENVHATGYEPEGDSKEAERLTFACWRAVDQAGIRRAEVDEEFGDLLDYMAEQIESVNDQEVQRLVDKDNT